LSSHDEEVLCCIRTELGDMILTSQRIVHQALPTGTKIDNAIANLNPLTSLARGVYGGGPGFYERAYAVWDGAVGEIKHGEAACLAQDKVLDPRRKSDSIPYDQVAEVVFKSTSPSSFGIWLRMQGSDSPPEKLIEGDPEWLVPFWNLIPEVLPGKVSIDDSAWNSFGFKDMWIRRFCQYLTTIGFPGKVVKFVKNDASKGVIELSGCNFDFVVKIGYSLLPDLEFIVGHLDGKIENLDFRVKRDKGHQVVAVDSRSKNRRLADMLNSDSELLQLLKALGRAPWIMVRPFKKKGGVWVGAEKLEFENGVAIEVRKVEKIPPPPKELFQAVDRVACCIRTAAGARA